MYSKANYLLSCFLYCAIDNVKCIVQAGFFYLFAKCLKPVLKLGPVELFDFSVTHNL